MGFYAVMISGCDIELEYGDGVAVTGFFATRHVVAKDGVCATDKVIGGIRKEWSEGSLWSMNKKGMPRLVVERCERINLTRWFRRPTGYTFYSEE